MGDMSYNLFRRRGREDLCCAVPEDRVIPVFVTHEGWCFAGRAGPSFTPRGFSADAARQGSHLNGFYVFQEVRR